MNREGYESYFLHTSIVGLPVTLSVLWHYMNRIIVQMAPELQLDILVQDRLYGGVAVKKSSAFSLSTALGYEFLFRNYRISVGGAVRFHTVFYKPVLLTLEPLFFFRYRFNRIEKGD